MRALIVVDVQNDFCAGGALEIKGADSIIKGINELIQLFNRKKDLVVATMDYHPSNHQSFASNSFKKIGEKGYLNGLEQVFWPDHCVEGTLGVRLHKELEVVHEVIYKGSDPEVDSYSGFFDNGKKNKTDLDNLLQSKGIRELYLVGLATDYCVKHTALDALSLGYTVNVVLDCIKGVDLSPEDSRDAIIQMEEAGANLMFSEGII